MSATTTTSPTTSQQSIVVQLFETGTLQVQQEGMKKCKLLDDDFTSFVTLQAID